MRKVLFITQEYSSKSAGGAGVFAYELTKALARAGVEVHVMAPANKTEDEALAPNLYMHWHKVINKPLLKIPSHHIQVRLKSKQLVNRHNIPVIHTNNYAGVFAYRGRRLMIATIHHLAADEIKNGTALQNFIGYADIFFEKLCVKIAHKVTCDSHLIYEELRHVYTLSSTKLIVLPCGVDLSLFKAKPPASLRKKLGCTKRDFIIFSPGGARTKRKGLLDLIEALKGLPDRNFKVLLSGISRELGWQKELWTAVEKSGMKDRFIWAGEINYDELPLYYSVADIVAYPSTLEGFGLPALEALACERPFIGTRTGEMPYIIKDDKNGLLIDINNPPQLQAAIERLMKSETLREKLSRASRKSVKYYSWNSLANSIINLHGQPAVMDYDN